ncbi:MAG: B12-binding domain-containing radical SAM protein [Gemmatimonadota bacterium]
MKVLLVQPPQGTNFGFTNILRIEPLGLECVGGALEEEGHDVRIVDMRLDSWRSLQAEYESFGPDAVGVASQFMTDVYPALHVSGFLRALDPDVMLFAGGHHASLQTDDFLFDGTPFDALVVGEGEHTSQALLRALSARKPIGEVPGVMTLENRGDGFQPRMMTASLDEMPLPGRHLTQRYRRRYHHGSWVPSAAVETSRGCPFDCNFCSVWIFYARRARRRSPRGIMRDLETVPEHNIFFTDDIAFIHRPSYEELGNEIKAAGMFRNFSAETRADLVVKYEDMFDLWRYVGLRTIFLGIEKIDDAGLESVRKRTDQEKNYLAIRILQDKGIRPMTSFIVDPQWGEEDFDRLEAYLEEMRLDQPVFTVLTPLPGTELYEQYRSELVTNNYLMYDVVHSVLPTRLPLERFYERFARLYSMTAKHQRVGWSAIKSALGLYVRGYGFVFWRLLRALKDMRDPKAYLEVPVDSRPPGFASLVPETQSA